MLAHPEKCTALLNTSPQSVSALNFFTQYVTQPQRPIFTSSRTLGCSLSLEQMGLEITLRWVRPHIGLSASVAVASPPCAPLRKQRALPCRTILLERGGVYGHGERRSTQGDYLRTIYAFPLPPGSFG
jgi:hypothetical protein